MVVFKVKTTKLSGNTTLSEPMLQQNLQQNHQLTPVPFCLSVLHFKFMVFFFKKKTRDSVFLIQRDCHNRQTTRHPKGQTN